jgi:hypothetical protein
MLDSAIRPAKAWCVQPDISNADSDGVFIAYQAVGASGLGLDLLVIMEGFIPIDTMDDEPRLARAMPRLGQRHKCLRSRRSNPALRAGARALQNGQSGAGLRASDQPSAVQIRPPIGAVHGRILVT